MTLTAKAVASGGRSLGLISRAAKHYCGVDDVVDVLVKLPTADLVTTLSPMVMVPPVTLPVLTSKFRVAVISIVLAVKGPFVLS